MVSIGATVSYNRKYILNIDTVITTDETDQSNSDHDSSHTLNKSEELSETDT